MSTNTGSGLKDWAEWLLFFSSYFPLYIIMAVKMRTVSYDLVYIQTPIFSVREFSVSILSVLLLLIAIVVVAFLCIVVYFTRAENGQPQPVREPVRRNELFLSYILAHVIPFAFIDYSSILNLFAFLLLFFSIGVVQVRSDYLYINPLLPLLGYELYEMDGPEAGGRMLLAKTSEDPRADDYTLTAAELSNNVYITTR